MTELRAEKIARRYGGVEALRGVNFTVRPAAVNALIGENGAGKSTLMRILAGIEQPSGGRLLLDGREVRFASVREAAAAGIGIVHQELNLCPNLSVAANMFLSRPRTRGVRIDAATERLEARRLLDRLGARIDPDAPVGSLSIGEQQLVEIARALAERVGVLILDEPTSALSTAETERLFDVIGQLRRDGVGIVYISHRLDELLRIADNVTVLRDGALVESAPASAVSLDWIVTRMLGKDAPPTDAPPQRAAGGDGTLVLTGVNARHANGRPALDGVSIAIRAGEVTAIYGLLGAGRSELFEAICGARPASGSIRLDGREIGGMPIDRRLALGLQMIAEDRQAEGLFGNLPVGGNLSVSVLGPLARRGVIDRSAERSSVDGMIARLAIKARSIETPIADLSGGNQQKVMIGRSLLPGPRVLLLDEPGRGVDVGARRDIFDNIRSLATQGMALAFATSDLHEALAFADRILVMASGRIVADLAAGQASRQKLVHAANQLVAEAA